ncbi:MAG: FxsA family protein [Succinivibrio dextrinosolvens]|uniref:FxsA family protein n=1 Tax=Succinivibrio sp. TaxID=2053619 RepID=UPI0025DF036D|nr:FxsA family protein [Succinivibrio sp.]MDY6416361.1 FxsA family protein [Succinivibrio dextrinosolvens]MBQ9221371.1 FxsA family protein [Succinivibrio sp.]MDY6420403.1 FxsA family protein [Succinivibrio dextrinosolvens]MDY6465556.1 FxsA family protein [Succinivibrio dextrinosolvens]MDY6470320.1 FxsA family protein [Succinivibrio dextrinosolvens]
MQKLFLTLVILFVLEILLLIQIGGYIGGLNVIFIMFAMMVIGAVIIKRCFKRVMEQLQHGVVDIKIIFLPLSGFLFLFPGFISDVLALLLLLPFVQSKCAKVYSSKSGSGTSFAFRSSTSDGFTDVFSKGRTIDGTATVVQDEKEELNHNTVDGSASASDDSEEKNS